MLEFISSAARDFVDSGNGAGAPLLSLRSLLPAQILECRKLLMHTVNAEVCKRDQHEKRKVVEDESNADTPSKKIRAGDGTCDELIK